METPLTAHRDIAAPFDKLRSTRATAASQAYSAIRNDIIYGRLPPGQKLKIDALCKRHEVTLNPIREALNRLSAEGLVVQEDQKGFSVAPISIELWRELVQSRCMLEDRGRRMLSAGPIRLLCTRRNRVG